MTHPGEITEALRRLRNHDVIGLPTETVYGLAASLASPAGLEKIFRIKNRPYFDPLIVHVSSLAQARDLVVNFPPAAEVLAKWFWPGPLTLVLPKSADVPDLVTSGLKTVAVRWPRHPVAQAVIENLGHPVAAPSANKFGQTSPTRKAHVESEFANEELFVLDGGDAEIGLESTVVAIEGSESAPDVWVLRPGIITREELAQALKPHFNRVQIGTAEAATAPGHLKYHYQPAHPLFVLKNRATLTAADHEVICEKLQSASPRGWQIVLAEDPRVCARELYGALHEGSAQNVDYLYALWPMSAEGGVWEAIWNRLEKAASHILD